LAAISGDCDGLAVDENFPGIRRFQADECLSKTLLPLPLGPMMTKISPGLTSKSMPLSTSWPSKLLRSRAP
jgi:hypothetical protein